MDLLSIFHKQDSQRNKLAVGQGAQPNSDVTRVLALASTVAVAPCIHTDELSREQIAAMPDGTQVKTVQYGIISPEGLRVEYSLYDHDDIPEYKLFRWSDYPPFRTKGDDIVVVVEAVVAGANLTLPGDSDFYCGRTVLI